MSRSPAALALAAVTAITAITLVAGCHAGRSTLDAQMQVHVDADLRRSGDDLAVLYNRASLQATRGEKKGAIATLTRLDERGWDFRPADRDFPGLADDPQYKALAARMAIRAPRVARAEVAMTLSQPGLGAEGIAYDEARGALFVGSISGRKIVRVAADGDTRDFAGAESGLYAVLGVRVDAAHGLLWAASAVVPAMRGFTDKERGHAGLFAFDLERGTLRHHVILADRRTHLFNDVAIADDGTAYVTDSEDGGVWRYRPGEKLLHVVLPAGSLFYPNGIVCDGHELLVAHYRGVARVPVAGGALRDLQPPGGATLGGFDGLYLDGDMLLGVQNGFGSPRVVRVDLDPGHARAERLTVLENMHEALRNLPTTGAVQHRVRRLLVVASGDAATTILSVPVDP